MKTVRDNDKYNDTDDGYNANDGDDDYDNFMMMRKEATRQICNFSIYF